MVQWHGYDPENLINQSLPEVIPTKAAPSFSRIGKPDVKVDAIKLVQGKPAFTADMDIKGLLIAKVLLSPHAHATNKKY